MEKKVDANLEPPDVRPWRDALVFSRHAAVGIKYPGKPL